MAAIVDAPLLVESGLYKEMDEIVAVTAPLPLRILRLKKRDGMDEEAIALRLSRQKEDAFYLSYADHAIVNDGDDKALRARITQIADEWRKKGRNG